ncbi:prepilin peptidase dependent protein A [Shimwellia blattae DSM 4481 = NBRC 105725]|uniref:Prepilin peptidase dependent protein A n=3 Tax=Shimwellia blattae TaxID=563 RepID=I2B5X3_SHIBC|nr:prepilin peptidase dependent protein A [Shimwellia blattae DSM 4481 = NBRC 105725]
MRACGYSARACNPATFSEPFPAYVHKPLVACCPACHTPPMTDNQQGHSLMELLIVMLIIVLTATGGYSWYQWQGHQQLRHSASALRDFLQYQRDRANGFNQEIVLRMGRGPGGDCVVAGTAGHIPACDTAGIHGYRPQSAGVKLLALSPGVAFFGLRNTAWPGHVVLAGRAGQARVVISAFGRIRLCYPPPGGRC